MSIKRNWKRWCLAGAVAGLIGASLSSVAGAASPPCASAEELVALNAKVLQQQLMVAGLGCGQRAQYNAFIRSYTRETKAYGKTLKAFFRRIYGTGAERELNSFVTKLANKASIQKSTNPTDYCTVTEGLFQEVLVDNPGSLGQASAKPWIQDLHGFPSCR